MFHTLIKFKLPWHGIVSFQCSFFFFDLEKSTGREVAIPLHFDCSICLESHHAETPAVACSRCKKLVCLEQFEKWPQGSCPSCRAPPGKMNTITPVDVENRIRKSKVGKPHVFTEAQKKEIAFTQSTAKSRMFGCFPFQFGKSQRTPAWVKVTSDTDWSTVTKIKFHGHCMICEKKVKTGMFALDCGHSVCIKCLPLWNDERRRHGCRVCHAVSWNAFIYQLAARQDFETTPSAIVRQPLCQRLRRLLP